MRIGGFVPLSLCDYPGRVAAVVFARGCNFRCPFCHNGHLLDPRPAIGPAGDCDEAEVLERIAERRTRLGGVVVSGGEPTLQPDLPDFLARLKDLGLAVKLDTNGSQPDVLAALLRRRLVDFVAMDVKAPWDRYHALAGGPCDLAALRRSVALLASAGVPHEFRTTRVDPLLTDDDLGRLRAQVPAGSPHRWQTFRPEHSLAPSLRPAVPAAGGETNAKQHTAMALPSRQV